MADSGVAFMDFSALAVTIIVGATVLALVYVSSLFRASTAPEESKTAATVPVQAPKRDKQHASDHAAGGAGKQGKKKQQAQQQQQHGEKWGRDAKQQFTHPWLMTSLKGHTGQILDMDFSANGKFLATCADDRTVLLWHTRDWTQREHKSVRVNVELDHATRLRWSPDSKAFATIKAADNTLEVYRVQRRSDGALGSVTRSPPFPKLHEGQVIALDIASSGRFIVTCSEGTDLVLSDLKGQQMARVDTYVMHTYCARISPCGRFIAASGFTPDVKVWEVLFSKSGEFQEVKRAFELSGHSSGVFDLSFNTDSSRIATVSKDGTWKLFNINVEFKKGEDPHLLLTQRYPAATDGSHACIALSPTGDVVAVASGTALHFFSARTGDLDRSIENIYSGPITGVKFDAAGKLVLTAGEKHVRVFHNVAGHRELVSALRERLSRGQGISSAQRDRMKQQIAEAQAFLAELSNE